MFQQLLYSLDKYMYNNRTVYITPNVKQCPEHTERQFDIIMLLSKVDENGIIPEHRVY